MLFEIKEKIEKGICLNDEDIYNLEMIPIMGPKEERKNLRIECLRLMNRALR